MSFGGATALTELAGGDPQLDANFLIRLLQKEPGFVLYATSHQTVGLSYNESARAEFIAGSGGSTAQLLQLEQQYGIAVIQDIELPDLHAAALRLQAAFTGDPLRRALREADARVAASAFLKNEVLATGDLQLFKRAKDLGLQVEFVGSGRAAKRAVS